MFSTPLLLETIIGHVRILPRMLEPTYAQLVTIIEFANIWFDIQDRRAIKEVDSLDCQRVPIDPKELNYRETNWVRPVWCAGCKEAPELGVEKRHHLQTITSGFVQMTQKEYV